MTREEKELALYCLKASSDYHSEVCEECIKYPNCDHTGQDDVTEIIIKAVEQEPCEDEYIKVPKEALKYRTTGMVAYNAEWLKNHFDIERAVICGAQPCEDAISRQAVISTIYDNKSDFKNDFAQGFFADRIRNLPPVTPQPKTGHWDWTDGDERIMKASFYTTWTCTSCGCKRQEKTKYCPNCGAKMESEEEE